MERTTVFVYDLLSELRTPKAKVTILPTAVPAQQRKAVMHTLDSHVAALEMDATSIALVRLSAAGDTVSSIMVPLRGVPQPITTAWPTGMPSGMVLAVSWNPKAKCGNLTWIDLTTGKVKSTHALETSKESVCQLEDPASLL